MILSPWRKPENVVSEISEGISISNNRENQFSDKREM